MYGKLQVVSRRSLRHTPFYSLKMASTLLGRCLSVYSRLCSRSIRLPVQPSSSSWRVHYLAARLCSSTSEPGIKTWRVAVVLCLYSK